MKRCFYIVQAITDQRGPLQASQVFCMVDGGAMRATLACVLSRNIENSRLMEPIMIEWIA